ncbi:DUF982 domain-containing protein [Hoeflea sp. YIM 152468]|uniref:DUF982 domain-containing protein n=1 Tax=Hoeflea sp. YIM 152468 TaxID=3031759 RepID=UPI0023DBC934|nr:DUF982 domain-containing protein [Hoeflea sp. YIM 152468]MDF1609384.1 DUF982 domain-containing protein [Hoeflea sp. YIM 152468]
MKTYVIYWTASVAIKLEGELIFVDGPLQAIELLEGDWPDKSGRHYLTALRECELACRLRGGLGSSRERFVAAALAAHVLEPLPIPGAVEEVRLAGSSAPFLPDAGHAVPAQADTSDGPQTKAALLNNSCSL